MLLKLWRHLVHGALAAYDVSCVSPAAARAPLASVCDGAAAEGLAHPRVAAARTAGPTSYTAAAPHMYSIKDRHTSTSGRSLRRKVEGELCGGRSAGEGGQRFAAFTGSGRWVFVGGG